MSTSTWQGDVYVNGNIASKTMTPPAASITDASIIAAAKIQATKLQHQYEPVYTNGASNANAATETRTIHIVKGGTATVVAFSAGAVVVLTGNDTCTLDLRKNGSTILTAVISLASTDTVRTTKDAGGFTSTAAVTGDWFEVVVTATHNTGTLPQGVIARLVIDEDAQ